MFNNLPKAHSKWHNQVTKPGWALQAAGHRGTVTLEVVWGNISVQIK
jgi:hypothetical protein